MSDDIEAIGAVAHGAMVAKAVEDEGKSLHGEGEGGSKCLNCGALVTGNFCGNCGQPLHVHRSIGAFWHDILHGVLHFEGKFWRTLPLLAWKPGELTRRYIHGERAKFISPMALFLFSIFMMFAVFSFAGSPFSSEDAEVIDTGDIAPQISGRLEELDDLIEQKTAQLATVDGTEKVELEKEILQLKKDSNIASVVIGGDMPYPDVSLGDGDMELGNYTSEDLDQIQERLDDIRERNFLNPGSSVTTGDEQADKAILEGLREITDNPDLLLYKLQANGYKFAWLLIPISLPFVWLTMIGRRGYRFYDHAVFTTYSIAFMSLLFITCALLAAWGAPGWLWGLMLFGYPVTHMFWQLRGAYQLGRIEAVIRLIFLLFFTVISLLLFLLILLALGILG